MATGEPLYEATTVMIYHVYNPDDPIANRIPEGLPHDVQISMVAALVTINDNLSEVIRRLQLSCTIRRLKERCSVEVEENTPLIRIKAQWGSPDTAADIANALRGVFIENHMLTGRGVLGAKIREIEDRLSGTRRKVDAAQDAIVDFVNKNQLAESDLNTEQLRQEIADLKNLHDNLVEEKVLLKIYPDHQDWVSLIPTFPSFLSDHEALSDFSFVMKVHLYPLEKDIKLNPEFQDKEIDEVDALFKAGVMSKDEKEIRVNSVNRRRKITNNILGDSCYAVG
jgi:hypothetical protein